MIFTSGQIVALVLIITIGICYIFRQLFLTIGYSIKNKYIPQIEITNIEELDNMIEDLTNIRNEILKKESEDD